MIGARKAIQDTTITDAPRSVDLITSYLVTLGLKEKFNTYIGELIAISIAIQTLARHA
jgi:hypothetical protein